MPQFFDYAIRSSYGNDSVALIQWVHEAQLENVAVVYSDTGWAAPWWSERIEQCETHSVTIFMAGDAAHAQQICREFCLRVGLCVTIEPTTYVYTGGAEMGFRIGLINYPRFPSSPSRLLELAEALADELREELGQHSYSITTPIETKWRTWRPGA